VNTVKERIREWIRKTGYDLVPYRPRLRGLDPILDVRHYFGGTTSPTIADVGANIGQTISRFKAIAPDAIIHSFEPAPATFAQLKQNHAAMNWDDVHLWNHGIGAENSMRQFFEHEKSVMSSFLKPGELVTGEVVAANDIPVMTLDTFASSQDVPFIDLLKIDTQGFEFQVLQGAQSLFAQNRVGMILFEAIVSDQYEGIAPLHTVLAFLAEHDFRLVGFYNQKFQRGLLSWMDVLMISREYYARPRA
jgi:FkbM family methyltransferase